MGKISVVLILLQIFMFNRVQSECTLREIEDCKADIDCIDEFNDIVSTISRWTCGEHDVCYYSNEGLQDCNFRHNFELFLNLKIVNFNTSSWLHYKLLDKYIQSTNITIIDASEISSSLNDLPNLKQVTLNYKTVSLNLNNLANITQPAKINISNNFIENLSNNGPITTLSEISAIDLSSNMIQVIPNSCFLQLPKLKHLNLSYNLISHFDTLSFHGLLQLHILDLSYNSILEIGHTLAMLTSLKEISIDHNNITSIIEPNFRMTVDLERINLNSNQIKVIENDSFVHLLNLEELYLSNNKLTEINIKLLNSNTKLNTLNISNNKIKSMDSEVFKNNKITLFDFNNNCLEGSIKNRTFEGLNINKLDLSVSKITKLESEAFYGLRTRVLNLSSNILSDISKTSFINVRNLEVLDLSNNKLSNIDFDSSDNKELLILDAHNNTIETIPRSMLNNLVSLTKLDLSFNKIAHIEPMVFLQSTKLEVLDLRNNLDGDFLNEHVFLGLSSLVNMKLQNTRVMTIKNNAFFGLRELKNLNFSHGELKNIEFEAFYNTDSIEVLDLSYNYVDNFQVNTTSIQTVKDLYLNNNEIRNVIKTTFTGLVSLQRLYLADNKIAELDIKSFTFLKSLQVLDLSSNSAVDIDKVFTNLPMLTELSLANIKKPFSFENSNNKSITKLNLSHNDIESINTIFIFKIENLEYLDLNSNKITFVDRLSFQNMAMLTWLDLSFNLISSIQPSSFSQTNNVMIMNLHDNKLPSLQFGVLSGLHNLRTLNLSSNAIHEFKKNLLHDNPLVSSIALDNNAIENFNFHAFDRSNLKVLSIGNNPISCHVLADFIKSPITFRITTEILDFSISNYNGIVCNTDTFSNQIVWPEITTNINGSMAFLTLSKSIENLQGAMKSLSFSIEKMVSKNTTDNVILQKKMLDVLQSLDRHIVNSNNTQILKHNNNENINEHLKTQIESDNEQNGFQFSNVNKLEIEYIVREKMRKEVEKMIDAKTNQFNKHFEAQTTEQESEKSDLKGLIYFNTISLMLLIVIAAFFILYKIFKPKLYNIRSSSNQRIPYDMELQNDMTSGSIS